jgi:hypothetical protein
MRGKFHLAGFSLSLTVTKPMPRSAALADGSRCPHKTFWSPVLDAH